MSVPRKLLAHCEMIRLEREEGGGAGIVLVEVRSYYDRSRQLETLDSPIPITFFFPNYGPSRWNPGQEGWVHFELYANWDNVSRIFTKEKWIRAPVGALTKYRYSLAGEMFQLAGPARDEDLYVNPGFPISLTLGLPAFPNKPAPIVNGQHVVIMKGDLFGSLTQWTPDLTPR